MTTATGKVIRLILRNHTVIVLLFFVTYFFIGLNIFRDYGFSHDEGTSRGNGAIAANYINQVLGSPLSVPDSIPDFKTHKDRDYGVLFELFLTACEFGLGLKESRSIFLMRHLMTFFMFFISMTLFYFLIKAQFSSWQLGLMGVFFIIISPRIFAHSFYNSKDIILMAFATIAMFSLFRFFDRATYTNALLHGICSAAVINIRIVGVYIPCITLLFLGLEVIQSKDKKAELQTLLPKTGTFLGILALCTYLFWPFLWESPIKNFIVAFQNMSKFRWDSHVFYWGTFLRATNIPWHYIPSWMAITTPVIITLLFITGMVSIVKSLVRKPFQLYKCKEERTALLFVALFFMPLLAVIILRSVLYDSWRQMFFIYPAFIGISIKGICWIKERIPQLLSRRGGKELLGIGILLVGIGILTPIHFMIKNHPYQNLYFNVFAGKNVDKKFDLDYWGLSFKEAFDFILSHDSRDTIPIAIANIQNRAFLKILKEEDQKRLVNVPIEQASYYVSNFRNPEEFEKYLKQEYPYKKELYFKKVNNWKIVGVYKL